MAKTNVASQVYLIATMGPAKPNLNFKGEKFAESFNLEQEIVKLMSGAFPYNKRNETKQNQF